MEKLDAAKTYADWLGEHNKPSAINYTFSDGSKVSYDIVTATTTKVDVVVAIPVE